MIELLDTGLENAEARLLLAHGAGAPMNSPFLDQIAEALARHRIGVSRFEFAYMSARRAGGSKRPPPAAEKLCSEYTQAIDNVRQPRSLKAPLLIGGKSLGGRVASMIADHEFARGRIAGLVCLGYPFHPPHQPGKLRTAHLERLACPALIVQGERDPFGSRAEVSAMKLSPGITVAWMGDGDHDFGPRGGSGFTRKGNIAEAAAAVAAFAAGRHRSGDV